MRNDQLAFDDWERPSLLYLCPCRLQIYFTGCPNKEHLQPYSPQTANRPLHLRFGQGSANIS